MIADEQATFDGRRVFADTVVAASPEQVFALLADPHRHREFDGSGTLRATVRGPKHLALGDRFRVTMQQGLLPYRVTNTVVAYEPDRRIGWCHFARAVWSYDLAPVEGGTRITETFDWSGSPLARGIEAAKMHRGNAKSIRDTLRRLKVIFGAPEA